MGVGGLSPVDKTAHGLTDESPAVRPAAMCSLLTILRRLSHDIVEK